MATSKERDQMDESSHKNPQVQKYISDNTWISCLITTLVLGVFALLCLASWQILSRVDKLETSSYDTTTNNMIIEIGKPHNSGVSFIEKDLFIRSLLEIDARRIRYAHANSAIISRMWTRLLGFLAGASMCIVGCIFIIARLKEDTTKVESINEFAKFSIASSSPGIILAFIGTILLVITLTVRVETDLEDASLYLGTTVYQYDEPTNSNDQSPTPKDPMGILRTPFDNKDKPTNSNNQSSTLKDRMGTLKEKGK